MRNKSLFKQFVKYFITYFVCFTVILIFCAAMLLVSYQNLRQNAIANSTSKLSGGMKEMENNVIALKAATQVVNQNQDFNKLCRTTGTLQSRDALIPDEILKQFHSINGFTNGYMQDSLTPYGFILLENNDYLITTEAYSTDYPSYYNNFLSVRLGSRILDAADLKELLFREEKKLTSFLKLDAFTYADGSGRKRTIRDAVLFFANNVAGSGSCFVFVMSPEALYDNMTDHNYGKAGYIRVTKNDKVLFDYNRHNDRKYYVIHKESKALGCNIEVGIQKDMIFRQTKGIRWTLYAYLFIGICGIFAMAFILVHRQYRAVKRVIDEFADRKHTLEETACGNPYSFMQWLAREIKNENRLYQKQIENVVEENNIIILQNLIVHGIVSSKADGILRTAFGQAPDAFCLAVIRMPKIRDRILPAKVLITGFLTGKKKRFLAVLTDEDEITILLPMEGSDRPSASVMETDFLELLEFLRENNAGCTCHIGISTVGIGSDNLQRCYHQAKRMLYGAEGNASFVQCYQIGLDTSGEDVVDLDYLNNFYRLLLDGKEKELTSMLLKLSAYYKRMPIRFSQHRAQVFYSITNVLETAGRKYPQISATIPSFSRSFSIDAFVSVLEDAVIEFCRTLNRYRDDKENHLKNQILSYIHGNYANPGLNLSEVSRDTKAASGFISDLIMDEFHVTFAVYLETCRLEKAKELLAGTDYSNEKIAILTGFGALNSFYRIFRKRTGMTPKAYRDLGHIRTWSDKDESKK